MSINATQLARMRAATEALLPDTAVIYTPANVSDGAGGTEAGYAAAGTVACRIDPITKQILNSLISMQEVQKVRYQLTVPYDAPLAQDTRVEIGGTCYDVIQLDVDHSWRVARRALISEVV